MSQSQRPAELELMEMWRGRWHSEFVTTTPGEEDSRRSEADQTFDWVLDGMYLEERLDAEFEDVSYRQMVLNTWDAQDGQYRFWTFDNAGLTGGGRRSYDAQTRTWHWKFRVRDAGGAISVGEGDSRFVSDDEIHHVYTVWNEDKKQVRSGAEGTSRRIGAPAGE